MPLYGDKARELEERLARLGVRPEDLEESFVHSGGKGGQNVNKVATCVVLVHRPTGIAVKCQRERSQGANRLIARRMLADKIEELRLGAASKRQQEAERIRRQKRRRSRRAKQRMLRNKHAQSEKKALRGPVFDDDLYDAIAPIYDEWQTWNGMTPFARVAAARLGPILDREAAAIAGAGHHPALLDLGCGTGTLLLDVRRNHPAWRLAGADASAGMLAAARAKTGDAGDVTWARANLGALPFGRAFDVCTAFYDTINHLPDAASLARAFAAVAAVLRPPGLLVFDVTSRQGFEQWWDISNTFTGTGWRMSIDGRFDRARATATGNVTFQRAGRTRRFRITERYFGPDEIGAALAASGFTVERQDAWSPFPIGGLGKTWWEARLR